MKLNLGKDLYIKGRIGWQGLSKDEYLESSDYKIINATALMDGYVDWDNCGYISKERYEEASEIMLQENDILISKDGTLGKIGYVKGLKYACSVASGIFVLRNTHCSEIDFDYLYHVLKSSIFKDFIRRNKAIGSTIPHLYQRDLENFELDLPDINAQHKISKCLNLLDAKISLNDSIISELESLAKTIYDYWFLQFDFPDENGKPYKSSGGNMVWNDELKREIPDGWEVRKLPTVADIQYGIPLSTELFSEEGAPVIRIRDIIDNSISAFTSEKVSMNYLTKDGDLLVGMDGNFQMNYWFRDNEIVNQRIVRVRETTLPIMIIRYQIEPYIVAKVDNVARSTVGHLGDDDIKNLKIIVPSQNLDYTLFTMIIRKISILKKEMEQLTTLRDYLLPMLMNGQVSIVD